MVSSHICESSCLEKSKLRNQLLKCFGCDQQFNAKCFDKIPSLVKTTSLSPDSNLIFICGKCHQHLSKLKPSLLARKSLNQSVSSHRSRVSNSVNDDAVSLDSQPSQVSEVEKLRMTTESNTDLLRTIHSHIMKSTVSQCSRCDQANQKDYSSEFSRILDKLAIIESASNESSYGNNSHDPSVKSFVDHIVSLIDAKLSCFNTSILSLRRTDDVTMKHSSDSRTVVKNTKNAFRTMNDPLDWSFSSPKPQSPNFSDDIFSLIHSFEANTWASFDSITNSIKRNTDALNSLLSGASSDPIYSTNPVTIALVESINRDDKLESIHHDLRSLTTDFTSFVESLNGLQMLKECNYSRTVDLDLDLEHDGTAVESEEREIDSLRARFHALLSTTNDQPSTTGFSQPVQHVNPTKTSTSTSNSLRVNGTDHYDNTSIIHSDLAINKFPHNSLHLLGASVKPAKLERHFHISPFDIKVSPKCVLDYIAENAQINRKLIRIHRLIKKGQDVSALSHVNFKIETNEAISEMILQPKFWPDHIRIKPWAVTNTVIPPPLSFL